VRIWNAGLKCAARGSLQIQDAKKRQKLPSGHHRTTSSGHIFATKARIDNRKKKLVKQHTSSTCAYSMVNFGPLVAEILSLVWGTPAISRGFAFWIRYCSDVAQQKSTKLHDVWPSPGLVHYIYIGLVHYIYIFGISCPLTEFCHVQNSLCVHLHTIAQLCRAISSQLRHLSTIGKKLTKQQYVLQMSSQYAELQLTNG